MIKQEGIVKRCDLSLRVKYFGIKTEIYQIDNFRFAIFCENYKGNFIKMNTVFNHSIKPVGTNILLVKERPKQYIKKIESISFDNVVDGFKATCVTLKDLNDFIKLRFYNIDIISVSVPASGIDFEILVEVSNDTSQELIENLYAALMDFDLGTDKISIKKTNKNPSKKQTNNFDVMLLSLYEHLPFTIDEGVFWLDNAERIYSGGFNSTELMFFRPNTTKCFFDFTVFDNINIRSALLLYDTVYIAPPLCNGMNNFLTKQGMTLEEFIELVEMGKVVLLLPNDETRYDKRLLLEVYKKSPISIVGRRGINTLLSSYLAETKKSYEILHPNIYDIASEIYMMGIEDDNIKFQIAAKFMAWPKIALIKSFSSLNVFSPMSVCNFGINDILYDKTFSIIKKENISFEFIVNSLNAYIAAALQATYFPFRQVEENGFISSDYAVSKIIGDMLSFFSYDAGTLGNLKDIYTQGKDDYINLFDCKENIGVLKVAEIADKFETHKGFRDILIRLGNLGDEERTKVIREYNDVLFEITEGKKNKGIMKFVMGGTGFLPFSTVFSHFLTSVGLLKDFIDETEQKKKYDDYKKIENQMRKYGVFDNQQKVNDIYLLDKISRVATLK